MPVSAINFQKLCGLAWSARLAHCPLKPCAITAPGLGPLWSACLCLPPVLVPPAFPQVCPLGASYSDCLGSHPSHLAEVRDLVPLSGSGCGRKQVQSEWTNRRRMSADGMAAYAHSPDFDLDLDPQTGKRMDIKFPKSTTAR